ncbi:hypothetical protein [Parasphingorhabdus halotolerans]|uniref:Lipoprotein n=1 Tax=Parasphingorhabdus halotolerans TaxID=2725558 RepID=A0A6H2DP83_9SPHN|nr:hypothetical protein [Parasphingorhabdus halotolerans]QJB69793.1 hypothetical protein HF685_11300 [Parasphingorhabdus halotolerans]
MMRFAMGLALIATLAACATPETRVRKGLMSAGLSQPIAACMADRMIDRLSLGQLNKLNGLGKLKKRKAGDVTFNQFVKETRALQDPEIVGVVTSSGLICAVK